MPKLGKLKRLDVKEIWDHEAKKFTPWLEKNINMLSETVGLEIDLIDREFGVGAFSVDLYGKDLNSGRPVIIENQLYPTDHNHLGQLLTYAAGLEAGVVIWISPTFRDEHRQSLDWLNSITKDEVSFFGIGLEVLQIGDSSPAVNFKLVVQPSELPVTRPPISEKGQRYHDFYSELLPLLKEKEPSITTASSVGYGNWFAFGAGRGGFSYSFCFTLDSKFRVELYIDTGDLARNKEVFDHLQQKREEIEGAFGTPLAWERLDDKKACRIAAYHDGSIFDSKEELKELSGWAIENMVKFRKTLSKHIKKLQI